ncbi:CASP-like protein 2D1 [Euphorbia peplus]|nr:CASP-like protein 2D1 [Euphorbia peplus]
MAPLLKVIDNSLRLSVLPLSAATIWLISTNHQHNPTYGYLTYSHLLGLKYMIWISGICGAYALIAAVSTWIKCLVNQVWVFFVSDQIVAYLMVTSGAAVMELLYLGYNGDKEITWSEACSSYGKFCNRIKNALILHALGVACFLVLAVISAYRAFSMFQPPLSTKQVEHPAS